LQLSLQKAGPEIFGYTLVRKDTTSMRSREGWRRQHHDDLHTCTFHQTIIRVVKSRATRWAVHVAHETRNTYKFSSENLKGRGHSEDLGVYGTITLDWIFGKYGVKL
jgi:hypothetical protein